MTSNTGAFTSVPDERHARLPYLPGLDGLRAIAVIAVLLFHAGLDLRGGFLGVESFFVLSGFLITGLLLAEWREHGRVDLGRFWLRRARRLLPALFLVLASTLLYAIMFLPSELAEVRSNVAAALLYVMNWQLVWTDRPYFDPSVRPPLLQHLWSLAVEEQFYLLWPLLFVALVRMVRVRGLLLVTLAAAVASAMLMALLYRPGADPSRIYYGTDTRAAGLLLGAVLAVVWRPGHPPGATKRNVGSLLDTAGVLALSALIAAYLRIYGQHPLLYPGGFVLVGLATAVIVMAVTHPQTRLVPGVLGWQPLRWIGLRSYGLYLWHWPIFQVTRPYLDVPLQGWLLLALRLALTAAIAALSYRWVESPIRNGAIERAWQTREGWGRVASRLRNAHRWDRQGLRVPLMVMLMFAGAIWLASIGTPRAAGGDAAAARAPGPTVAADAAIPGAAAVRPTAAPVTEASAPPAARPTSSLSMSMASRPTAIMAVAGATANADRTEHGAEPAPAPATPTTGVDETPSGLPPLDAALTAELQRLLDNTVAGGFVPGAVLSISIPGYLPWSSASGVADRQRELLMKPNTLVHIGSVTKMFTAVVVLQLAGEGKIDLDAPI
ncbi:MAG TPA: acyltransferase family protein, partial [Herpetosiphonaceae bacterium]|nr:acyltransferase family protein [Herpetosiphonaceae bacterium]